MKIEGEVKVPEAIPACPHCGRPAVPPKDAQIEMLKFWQRQRPPIFHWTLAELRRLRDRMEPGDLLCPDRYASVTIRGTDGSMRIIEQRELADE